MIVRGSLSVFGRYILLKCAVGGAMMKQQRKIHKTSALITALMFAAILCAGCGSQHKPDGTSSNNAFELKYGSCDMPSGWVKDKDDSTSDKPFFVPKGYDGNGVPDNISIEYGRNRYSKEQSQEFGNSILQQLGMQTRGQTVGQITASGTTTKHGDTMLVYKFSLSDRTCTQYYIVGDRSSVMVYETNFDGSSDCDEAAKQIADTFKWK